MMTREELEDKLEDVTEQRDLLRDWFFDHHCEQALWESFHGDDDDEDEGAAPERESR